MRNASDAADGSIPALVDATAAGWRLEAVADGLDSLLYLGLLEPERVGELLLSAIVRELDVPVAAPVDVPSPG